MQSKPELRKQMLEKRTKLNLVEQRLARDGIMEKLFSLKEFKSAKTVCFYISKDQEVATKQMIKNALKLGKKVLVPVTNQHIELVEFTSFEDLAPGAFGVLEPKTKNKTDAEPEIIIVPALAFDLDCHRLGYGKGYYDKFLKTTKAMRIGIAYDFAIVDVLPRHEHDIAMDLIITDNRILENKRK